jgi:hypothetical protein
MNSRLTKIGLAVLAVVMVVWLVLTLYASGGKSKTASAAVDDKHCPKCGMPLPRGGTAKECPYCFLENQQSGGKGAKLARGSGIVVPIVVISLIVLLVGANVFVKLRARWKEQRDENYYIHECRKCSRKIRFRVHQFGTAALCPLCKRPFIFPKLDVDRSRWLRMKQWLNLAPR